ncbi:hypothetical protein DM01DRAFT_154067 [Hesseltinella vesiculosa]|uniref:Uncharacterized protein n=1 Tax=Hesseltinella vesiculosa TaxID=101127 RepID=A0A1X2GHQ4_9FUNG|nr:hypothetical protein DM01DRAFT_154067 [Hesseltinella vesiculosa]
MTGHSSQERTPLLSRPGPNHGSTKSVTCNESRFTSTMYWLLCMFLWWLDISVNMIGGYIVEKVYYS